MKKLTASIAAFAVLGTVAALADAHSDRQAIMHSNNAAMTALNAMLISELDMKAIKAQAQILIDNGGKIPALFASGTDHNDPAILPALWTDAAGFKAANDKFIADAKAIQALPSFSAAAPTADRVAFADAMSTLQGDCGACHKGYRVPPPAPAGGRGGRRGGGAGAAAAAAANADAAAPAQAAAPAPAAAAQAK